MRRILLILAGSGFLFYGGLYLYFYSIQDDRFRSIKLSSDYKYSFEESFHELNFCGEDGGLINSLLFKSDSSRGILRELLR